MSATNEVYGVPFENQVALAGDWALWRDFAIRAAGFPVSGLDVFGAGDEGERLREVASNPLFREAVAWQNRQALVTQIEAIAHASPQSASKRRRREAVVANYWQRYCAKNETIGFFGPLAWGRAAEDGPALHASCGQLVSESTVHFEAWAIHALAEALDPSLTVSAGPHAERDLRTQLERSRPAIRKLRAVYAGGWPVLPAPGSPASNEER